MELRWWHFLPPPKKKENTIREMYSERCTERKEGISFSAFAAQKSGRGESNVRRRPPPRQRLMMPNDIFVSGKWDFPPLLFFWGGRSWLAMRKQKGKEDMCMFVSVWRQKKKPLPKNNDDPRVFFCRENLGKWRRVSSQQMGKSHRGKQMILLFLLFFFLGPSRLHFPDKTEVNEKRG